MILRLNYDAEFISVNELYQLTVTINESTVSRIHPPPIWLTNGFRKCPGCTSPSSLAIALKFGSTSPTSLAYCLRLGNAHRRRASPSQPSLSCGVAKHRLLQSSPIRFYRLNRRVHRRVERVCLKLCQSPLDPTKRFFIIVGERSTPCL